MSDIAESLPGGRFHVRRDLAGYVCIECPPFMRFPPDVGIAIARAILETAGAEVIFADPGSTVIRGNGNGKVL